MDKSCLNLPYSSTLNVCLILRLLPNVCTSMVHSPRGGSKLSGISKLTSPAKYTPSDSRCSVTSVYRYLSTFVLYEKGP